MSGFISGFAHFLPTGPVQFGLSKRAGLGIASRCFTDRATLGIFPSQELDKYRNASKESLDRVDGLRREEEGRCRRLPHDSPLDPHTTDNETRVSTNSPLGGDDSTPISPFKYFGARPEEPETNTPNHEDKRAEVSTPMGDDLYYLSGWGGR